MFLNTKFETKSRLPASPLSLIWSEGHLAGAGVKASIKRLGQIAELFLSLPAENEKIIYSVQSFEPVLAGSEGGLYWGVTTLEPGTVNGEYYMTHGHFHANASRAEYYATSSGAGLLLLMGRDRVTTVEKMAAGSLHYIPGDKAHRVVNVGDAPLIFWACWPSDAGYDYDAIVKDGFSVRVMEYEEKAVLVPCK